MLQTIEHWRHSHNDVQQHHPRAAALLLVN